MTGSLLQYLIRRRPGSRLPKLRVSHFWSVFFFWPIRLVQVLALDFFSWPASFRRTPHSGRSVFARVVPPLSLFWLILLQPGSGQAREMRTLNLDPIKTRWENTKQYGVEDCSQLSQDVMSLFSSRSPLKNWHSFSYKDIYFEFGIGGELQIEHRYRWQILPHTEGQWEFQDGHLLLKAQYRQFLIDPCMATCMAGSDYYPDRQDMDRESYVRWQLDAPLRNVNSCNMHCFRRILNDYGKTLVDFELQLKISTRASTGPDSKPGIVIRGLQIEDPNPAPGKQRYSLDLFGEPIEIQCD